MYVSNSRGKLEMAQALDTQGQKSDDILRLATEIVAAYVSNNPIPVSEVPAMIKSVHGTLNHLLLGDRIWMTRFEGGSHPSTDLGAVLYDDFVDLRAARTAAENILSQSSRELPRAKPLQSATATRFEHVEAKRLSDQPLRLRPDEDAVRPNPIFLANSERCAA